MESLCKVHSGVGLGDNYYHNSTGAYYDSEYYHNSTALTVIKSSVDVAMHITNSVQYTRKDILNSK